MPGSKLHVSSFATCLQCQVFASPGKKGEGAQAHIPEQRPVIEPKLLGKRAQQQASEKQRSREKNKCKTNAIRRGGYPVRCTIVLMLLFRLCEKRKDKTTTADDSVRKMEPIPNNRNSFLILLKTWPGTSPFLSYVIL